MTYHVVFHLDELALWDRVLGNAKNLLIAMDDQDLKVVILANGDAVTGYVESAQSEAFSEKLMGLRSKISFKACKNALNGHHIDPKTLYDFVEIVPSGVAELVLLQHQGYAYIKP